MGILHWTLRQAGRNCLRGLSSRQPSLLHRKLWVFSFPNKLSQGKGAGRGGDVSTRDAWCNLSTRLIVLPATTLIGRASTVHQLAQREGGRQQRNGRSEQEEKQFSRSLFLTVDRCPVASLDFCVTGSPDFRRQLSPKTLSLSKTVVKWLLPHFCPLSCCSW